MKNLNFAFLFVSVLIFINKTADAQWQCLNNNSGSYSSLMSEACDDSNYSMGIYVAKIDVNGKIKLIEKIIKN
jgi:hypothetical protein